jgi:hypothetical protein
MKGLTVAGATMAAVLGSFGPASGQMGQGTAPTITVTNEGSEPVIMYLERGEFDTRLGTVPAHESETLALPSSLEDGEEIQVFAHPEGGMDLASQDLIVDRGAELVVLVPDNDVGYMGSPPPMAIPNPGENTTTVTVENARAVPVTIFVERGEFDTRIGTVPPNTEETLTVPDWITREEPEAVIYAHPEGENDLGTWRFDMSPGAHLFLKVPQRGI